VIPAQTLAVTVSTHHAGARPVTVELVLRYEMQCGWPGPGTLTIRFPSAVVLPKSLSESAVLVDARPATSVQMKGHVVTLGLPKRPRIMCDVIGPGTLKVVFTRAANLGNPKATGRYEVTATHPTVSVAGRLVITPD
jgi:hypothetical protein